MKPKKKMRKPAAKKGAGPSRSASASAKRAKPTSGREAKRTVAAAAAEAKPPSGLRTVAQPAQTGASSAAEAQSERRTPTGAAQRRLEIPPILLEGDAPAASGSSPSGPGTRYALGPAGRTVPLETEERWGELPEAYGTKRLFLAARDPYWLYASWDLTREQLREYNRLSADGHLVLRTFFDQAGGEPVAEVHVHPESRNWFLHVPQAGARYVAELGYRDREGRWNPVSLSKATLTPPDTQSEDLSVQFTTIPAQVPLETLLEMVKSAVAEHAPLAEAVEQLRAEGHTGLPSHPAPEPQSWTPAQSQALAEVLSIDQYRRLWMGSLEITELVRRRLHEQLFSGVTGEFSLVGAERWGLEMREQLGISSPAIFSPAGVPGRGKGFWFRVNAELVIYGATEPDARVTIGGKPVKLRPDGSFSFRFALPDGEYELPAEAVSADGSDGREARLKFSRATGYRGDVGRHPQDPGLKAPLVENVG